MHFVWLHFPLLAGFLLLADHAQAAEVLSDNAAWGFPDFLVFRNATSKGWNFGNTAANAPTVTLLGVTMKGNSGGSDAASGLTFTTAPLTYSISSFAWTGTTEQPARDSLSRGGLHGGETGFFVLNLAAIRGGTYVIDILALDAAAPTGRSMDVSLDNVLVKENWTVTRGHPFNRVLRLRTVADADGIDLRFSRGDIPDTDHNPAISAVAVTRQLEAVEIWRQTHFSTVEDSGAAANHADPDRDGLENLVEFAFDLNPNIPDAALLPQWRREDDDYLLSFSRPPGVSGISYVVEQNESLASGDWVAIPNVNAEPKFFFGLPAITTTRRFLRLRVTIP
ncbi:MAG TPA: hypothetical protein VG796_14890 [Verrucomicrobiales bacterium]|nr:hypothetical protein [Verrucomicrobiales bacterium]